MLLFWRAGCLEGDEQGEWGLDGTWLAMKAKARTSRRKWELTEDLKMVFSGSKGLTGVIR
jgi:hypothetical protein